MKICSSVIYIVLCASTVAQAVGTGVRITYEGKGAGEIVFDGSVHAAGGLTCADCHKANVFTPALFEMKRGANLISMRKIEMGRSCGCCHNVSQKDILSCEKCHHK